MDFGVDEQFIYEPSKRDQAWLWVVIAIILLVVLVIVPIGLYLIFRGSSAQAIGTKCTMDSDCTTNNCSLNYCQIENTITGQESSYCDIFNGPRCNQGLYCLDHTCQMNVLVNGTQCQSDSQCQSNNCSLSYCQPRGVRTGTEGAFCQPVGDPRCINNLDCVQNTCISPFVPPTPIDSCPPNMSLINGQCYPLDNQPCAEGLCGKGNCTSLPFLYQLTEDNWLKIENTPGMIINLQSSIDSIWGQTKQGIFQLKQNKPTPQWMEIVPAEFKIYANGRSFSVQLKSYRVRRDNELMIIGTLTVDNEQYDGLFLYMPRARGRDRFRPFNTWDTNKPGSQGVRAQINGMVQLLDQILNINFQVDETGQYRLLILTHTDLYYTLIPLHKYIFRSTTQTAVKWIWSVNSLTFTGPLVVYEPSSSPAVIVAVNDGMQIYISGSAQQQIDAPGTITDIVLNRSNLGTEHIVIVYHLTDNNALIARWSLFASADQQWVAQPGFYNSMALITTTTNSLYLSNVGVCFVPRVTPSSTNCGKYTIID